MSCEEQRVGTVCHLGCKVNGALQLVQGQVNLWTLFNNLGVCFHPDIVVHSHEPYTGLLK